MSEPTPKDFVQLLATVGLMERIKGPMQMLAGMSCPCGKIGCPTDRVYAAAKLFDATIRDIGADGDEESPAEKVSLDTIMSAISGAGRAPAASAISAQANKDQE